MKEHLRESSYMALPAYIVLMLRWLIVSSSAAMLDLSGESDSLDLWAFGRCWNCYWLVPPGQGSGLASRCSVDAWLEDIWDEETALEASDIMSASGSTLVDYTDDMSS